MVMTAIDDDTHEAKDDVYLGLLNSWVNADVTL
jgi:hypothetical protein